jgi:hypothetical protein
MARQSERLAPSGYPVFDAGDEADPPARPAPAVIAAARRAHHLTAPALDEPDDAAIRAAGNWRVAGSLMALLEEANDTNPARDRASDGGIGDLRHAKENPASDHLPRVVVDGRGVVRARDFDEDGLDIAGSFERMRARAHAGDLPQLADGGYLIYADRITAEDFSGWREYLGTPHVLHGHVSVSRDPRRFDDRRRWGVWAPDSPAAPVKRPPAARWTGPDLRGTGTLLRGEEGASGPRVQALQRFLSSRVRASPAVRGLDDDGEWGPRTTAALAEFARRSVIRDADGTNIGPKIATKLHLAGFRG